MSNFIERLNKVASKASKQPAGQGYISFESAEKIGEFALSFGDAINVKPGTLPNGCTVYTFSDPAQPSKQRAFLWLYVNPLESGRPNIGKLRWDVMAEDIADEFHAEFKMKPAEYAAKHAATPTPAKKPAKATTAPAKPERRTRLSTAPDAPKVNPEAVTTGETAPKRTRRKV
jgi:hypothetical protein